jgi:hypothetical protein
MLVKFPVPVFRVKIFPVVPLKVFAFDVVALLVVAYELVKYPFGEKMVPTVADTAFKIFPAKFPVAVKFDAVVDASVEDPLTVRLVNSPVAKARMFPRMLVTVVEARVEEPVALMFVELSMVVVELVMVALVAVREVGFRVEIERLVIVAFVIVAFDIEEEEAFEVEANTVVS